MKDMVLTEGRSIHRSDFSIIYNNIVRGKQIKQLIAQKNIQLPSRRDKQSARPTIEKDFISQPMQIQIQQ